MDKFIVAKTFQRQQVLDYNGKQGQNHLLNVDVMVLSQVNKNQDVLEFAGIWNKIIQDNPRGLNIYGQLFLKLVNEADSPPESLAILFETKRPEVFSYLVYFDQQIRVNNSVTEIKGSAPVAIEIPEDLAFDGYIKDAKLTPEIRSKLLRAIVLFLKSNTPKKIDPNAKVTIKNKYESLYVFTAVDLKGRITKSYYDRIKLYLSFIPVDQKKFTADISYNFTVKYGSAPYSVAEEKNNYEDGVKRYAIQMAKFNEDLRELIQNTTDVRNKN